MSDPEAPPPSSSPPTAREPAQATGGLDPDPPDPGASVAKGIAPHAFLVSTLFLATLFSRGDALLFVVTALLLVSAWAAWLLARLDARHRPIAWGLAAMAACALVREGLHVAVLHGGPYAGWARVAFHVEEAARLATAALPAWMAWSVLTKTRRFITGVSAGNAFLFFLLFAVKNYPELRGDALRKVYLGAELAGLFVAALAIVSWVRRRGWRPMVLGGQLTSTTLPIVFETRGPLQMEMARWYTWAPIVWLVAGDALLLLVGAWRWGLFREAYAVQQAGLLVVWGCVAAMQVAALVMARRAG